MCLLCCLQLSNSKCVQAAHLHKLGSRDMWIAKPVYCLKYKLAEAIPNGVVKSASQTPIQLQANGNICRPDVKDANIKHT